MAFTEQHRNSDILGAINPMRRLILGVLLLSVCQNLFGQYQKTINTNNLSLSGFDKYYALAFSRQTSKNNNLAFSAFYYKDEGDTFSLEHYLGNAFYSHTFLRISDLYFNGGGGLFFAHTKAEDLIGNTVSENSTGITINAELEYYLSHWLIAFSDVKQMVFLNSDFVNNQFVYGFGIKIVF